jgi:8-oxo-dGTP diphosphatase
MNKGKDYISVACGAIIFNKEDKVLIGQRGSNARDDEGMWDFPGGQVEFGESCNEAIKREMKEEFGIQIEIIEIINFVEVIESKKHWVGPTYIAKLISGEAKPLEKDKFNDFKWVDITEIEKLNITTPCKQNIGAYKKKYSLKPFSNY